MIGHVIENHMIYCLHTHINLNLVKNPRLSDGYFNLGVVYHHVHVACYSRRCSSGYCSRHLHGTPYSTAKTFNGPVAEPFPKWTNSGRSTDRGSGRMSRVSTDISEQLR